MSKPSAEQAARRARTLMGASATVALIGISLCASDNAQLGAWVTLAGLIGLIAGLHRFGRTGPDVV